MGKTTSVLMTGLFMLTGIPVYTSSDSDLIRVSDIKMVVEDQEKDSEAMTDVFSLSDSYEAQLETILAGDFISVTYPVLVHIGTEDEYACTKKVNQLLEEQAKKAVEAEVPNMKEMYEELMEYTGEETASSLCYETSCGSIYLLGSAYSVMQSHYTYYGGVHPYSWVTGVTYDLNTGEEMTMGEILGCSEETAQEAVVAAYREHIIDQVENVTEESIRENFDAMEYWFDEEGMRVSLAPYIVASYAAGPQDVLVTQDHVTMAQKQ